MISEEKVFYIDVANAGPDEESQPAEEQETVEETRKEQREEADPEEQSPTRKGYG